MANRIYSYTSVPTRIIDQLYECWYLYCMRTKNIKEQIRTMLERLRKAEDFIKQETGLRIRNLKILEIGPGQCYLRSAYFSCWNDVIGIDFDIIPVGLAPLTYLKMFFSNDFKRIIKTIARKAAGIDRKLFVELQKQIGMPFRFDKVKIIQGDAKRLPFEGNSFDFIFSYSTLEHILDPGVVIDESKRVLKPHGIIYFEIHQYTSESGCHDLRIFSGCRSKIPYWAHLRPQYRSKVSSNAYLNKIRLDEWKKLFITKLPGTHFRYLTYDNGRLKAKMKELRDAGELTGYSPEELLTVDIAVLWQKPV